MPKCISVFLCPEMQMHVTQSLYATTLSFIHKDTVAQGLGF